MEAALMLESHLVWWAGVDEFWIGIGRIVSELARAGVAISGLIGLGRLASRPWSERAPGRPRRHVGFERPSSRAIRSASQEQGRASEPTMNAFTAERAWMRNIGARFAQTDAGMAFEST